MEIRKPHAGQGGTPVRLVVGWWVTKTLRRTRPAVWTWPAEALGPVLSPQGPGEMPAGGCPAQRHPLGFLLVPEYSGARNLRIIKEESQPDLKCLLDEELSCLLSSDVRASSILFFVSQDGACISMAFSTQKAFFPQGATTAEQHGAGGGGALELVSRRPPVWPSAFRLQGVCGVWTVRLHWGVGGHRGQDQAGPPPLCEDRLMGYMSHRPARDPGWKSQGVCSVSDSAAAAACVRSSPPTNTRSESD